MEKERRTVMETSGEADSLGGEDMKTSVKVARPVEAR